MFPCYGCHVYEAWRSKEVGSSKNIIFEGKGESHKGLGVVFMGGVDSSRHHYVGSHYVILLFRNYI